MSKQFSADSEENSDLKGAKKKSQAQLLVLLLLVAAGAYVYFFTGLVKPREEAPAPQPQQTAQVKQPMPPRQAEQKVEQPAPAPQQAAPAAVAASPAPTPAPAPAPAQAAAGQKAPAAQAPAKPESTKTAKTETSTAQKAPAKPAAADDKQVAATAKPADNAATKNPKAASTAGKAAAPAAAGKQVAQVKQAAGAFTLKTIETVFSKDIAAVETKLKKAGLKPVRHQSMKQEPMNRLFYAEYPDRQSAGIDLEQLKAKIPDAFIIEENGKYSIYAGSYLKEGRAAIEQDRLFDKGLRLVMKKTQVKVPVTYLTAGSFASEEDAVNTANKLKKNGIKVSVVKSGKKPAKK